MLESEAHKRAVNQIEIKNKVCGFVLDGDNKKHKILQQNEFMPQVFKDPNHLSLCFNRYLDSKLSEKKKIIPGVTDATSSKGMPLIVHSILLIPRLIKLLHLELQTRNRFIIQRKTFN
ncbi:hypothetical protein M9Y10_024526 [Tritrichomonas musculus]|uniref:Reverse transcriptase domain-containing protein n=1 Tax=Tritrichomonas musculus TaxID=1915356 RepID=A0ABR2HEH4_9EUKA